MASSTATVENDRIEAARAYVELCFDEAFRIREELYGTLPDDNGVGGTVGLIGRKKANRDQLRSFAAQGILSDDLLEELEDLYPTRDPKRRTDEERAAELEARAKEIRERAAKAAKDAAPKDNAPKDAPKDAPKTNGKTG